MDAMIGRTLGPYQIMQLLGKGGMASVYKAYQPSLQRSVALKILPPNMAQNPEFSKRFEREARAVARLDHPNILPVYDFGTTDGFTYIVMKYVDGGTLKDMLEQRGKLPFDAAAQILSQIASALDYAHGQGVIHRDIKPANVLMARPDWALLSDFGLVKVAEGSMKLTGSGIGLGTPEYMAPEQASGLETDARADIYSLGVMLYAMVTGQVPYTGSTPIAVILKHVNEPLPSPRASNPDLPPAAETAILQAMAKKPDDRPTTAGQLSHAFSVAVGSPATAEATRPAAPPAPGLPVARTPSWAVPQPAAGVPTSPAAPVTPAAAPVISPAVQPATRQRDNRGPLLLIGVAILVVLAIGVGVLLSGRNTAAPSATVAPTTPAATIAPTVAPATSVPVDTSLKLPVQSTVQIWALQKQGSDYKRLWSGSGSIVTSDGLILTNAHVVLPDKVYGNVDGLEVSLTLDADKAPEPTFLAKTVIANPDLDLAVIKITSDLNGNPVDATTLSKLLIAQLGDSDKLKLGDELFILGYPGIGGENITLTNGRVAGFTNEPSVKGRAFVKTDATIAGGNSGGLASDASGYLVGIPTQLGYGGDNQYVDCRVLADTNGDGVVDSKDSCVPTGGFINALRPINLAIPMIQQAEAGVVSVPTPAQPARVPIEAPSNAGEVLFSDDFSTESGGWGTSTDDKTSVAYQNGQMVIDVKVVDYVGWTTPNHSYDDLDIEADTQRLGGPTDNEVGLIVRYQDDDNFYVFSISSDGFYEFNKRAGGKWNFLIPWTPSSLIDQQTGFNRIAVVAEKNRFTFYINDVQVNQTTDDAFSGGDVGLLAGAFGEAGVSVAFDNVRVRVPGGPRQAGAQGITPTTGQKVVLSDDFSTNTGNWFLDSTDKVKRSITNGEFTLKVLPAKFTGWSEVADLDLADVIVEVDARRSSGPDLNAFGVLCRYLDQDNYYALEIGTDGTYAIYQTAKGQYKTLVDWTASEALKTGSDTNHLRAECIGDHIRLFANGTQLTDVVDEELGSGSVALIAETFDTGNLEVKFDNAVIAVPTAQNEAQVLFSDDFSSPDSGWDRGSDKETQADYVDSKYQIAVNITKQYVWGNPGKSFEDAVIDVDAHQLAGPDNNDYGVLCRYQDNDNFYRILISGDGYYTFLKLDQGESTTLIDWTRSSAINQGAASNHLTVTCAGNRLALSINGEYVAEASDDTFGEGDIGLTAGAFDTPGVKVAFDNLVVTAP